MSVDRCPSCAAAVPAGAPWCTLCWTPLRRTEAPAPEPALSTVTLPATPAPLIPEQARAVPAPEPAPSPAPAPAPAPAAVTWPCVNCHVAVPMAEDACPECGQRFLASPLGDDPTQTLLDRLPEVTQNKGFGLMVIVVGSLGLTVLIVAALTLLAVVF